MKRIALKVTNYVAWFVASSLLGKCWGKLFGWLFIGFLTDEAYAEAHPKKYLLGVIGILLLICVSAYVVISLPINWLWNKTDKMIDDFADDKDWD